MDGVARQLPGRTRARVRVRQGRPPWHACLRRARAPDLTRTTLCQSWPPRTPRPAAPPAACGCVTARSPQPSHRRRRTRRRIQQLAAQPHCHWREQRQGRRTAPAPALASWLLLMPNVAVRSRTTQRPRTPHTQRRAARCTGPPARRQQRRAGASHCCLLPAGRAPVQWPTGQAPAAYRTALLPVCLHQRLGMGTDTEERLRACCSPAAVLLPGSCVLPAHAALAIMAMVSTTQR